MPLPKDNISPVILGTYVCSGCSEDMEVKRIAGPTGKLVRIEAFCKKCQYWHYPNPPYSNGENTARQKK